MPSRLICIWGEQWCFAHNLIDEFGGVISLASVDIEGLKFVAAMDVRNFLRSDYIHGFGETWAADLC